MKLTKKEARNVRVLAAQHDGLDVLASAAGIARGDRSVAYPVENRGRVGWFKQVCHLAGRETGRNHWVAAVVRANRPANAVAILRALED